jgi:hypothetical protein
MNFFLQKNIYLEKKIIFNILTNNWLVLNKIYQGIP